MKKNLFFTALIFFVLSLMLSRGIMAANFYFSTSTGDDDRMSLEAKNPETPWKSIEKFNKISGSLIPGDTVFFRCGEIFYGQIRLKSSGTDQNPIIITSYGSGEAPEISGWIELKYKTSISKSINRFDLSGLKLSPNQKIKTVSVGGVIKEKGRYPNDDYLLYNVAEKDQFITYNNMQEIESFDRATIVLRMNEWIFDKARIVALDHQGISFSKETEYNPTDKYGFFIQDHFKTLDRYGEWYHDEEEEALFVLMELDEAENFSVKISLVDHLLSNEKRIKHVIIDGINFSGSNKSAISFEEGEHITIKNCNIESAGEDGIKIINVSNMTISGNTISDTFDNGIFLRYGTPNATIANNNISNVNIFPGMGSSGDQVGIGIYSRSDAAIISGNKLKNIGYSGIFFGGNHTVVEKNIIDGFCLTKNDGGGIYTYEGKRNQSYQNRLIQSNTIVNGIGIRKGNKFTSSVEYPQVEGIYIDDNASGIDIIGNKIGNMSRNGINLHNAREINIKDNTVFNCANLLSFSHDKLGDPISKVKVIENRLITMTNNQKSVKLTSKLVNLLEEIHFQLNEYHHPASNDFIFQLNESNLDSEEWSKYEKSHKSIPLKSMEGTKSNKSISASTNLIGPANRKIDALNKDCKVEIGGNLITVLTTAPLSGIKIRVGEVKKSKDYIIRIVAKAETPTIVQAYLRTEGSPWTTVSESHAFKILPINQEMSIRFSNVMSTLNPVIMLKVEDKSAKISISALSWQEDKNSPSEPPVILKFHKTNHLEEILFEENVFKLKN